MSAESESENSHSTTPEESDGATSEDSESLSGATSEGSENSHDESEARPNADSEQSSWIGYGLAVVLVGTLVLGLLRPFYPTASALALGAFLALFGVFVGVLAFRERGQGS